MIRNLFATNLTKEKFIHEIYSLIGFGGLKCTELMKALMNAFTNALAVLQVGSYLMEMAREYLIKRSCTLSQGMIEKGSSL